MAKTAKSISADKLAALTREAVRSVGEVKGRFVGRGEILGFVAPDILAAQQLRLATAVTDAVAATARAQGVTGLRPKPVVVIKPGVTTAGFIAAELGIKVR